MKICTWNTGFSGCWESLNVPCLIHEQHKHFYTSLLWFFFPLWGYESTDLSFPWGGLSVLSCTMVVVVGVFFLSELCQHLIWDSYFCRTITGTYWDGTFNSTRQSLPFVYISSRMGSQNGGFTGSPKISVACTHSFLFVFSIVYFLFFFFF